MNVQRTPNPKTRILEMLLWMAVIFLGFQVFFGGFGQRSSDTRTAAEVLTKMRQLNAELRDLSIASEFSNFESKLKQEQKEKPLDKEQFDLRLMEGVILVADTQLKAGLLKNDHNRLNTAYMTLQPKFRAHQAQGVWQASFKVAPQAKLASLPATITPDQLYKTVVSELSQRDRLTPQYKFIDILVQATGKVPGFSYALAALILAILVRAVVWPLAQKQLMFSRQMGQLAPLISELKTQYKGNPQEMNVKVMELYKEYGINPAQGCIPALLQMPLFLVIYNCMVHYRFEFTDGTFLWINPELGKATNGWIAPNLGEMDYIMLGLYGATMVINVWLAPSTDPSTAKQQKLMGLLISLISPIFIYFWMPPSAFVLYWVFTNIFSSLQSYRAYRLPLAPLQKVGGPNGSVLPTSVSNGQAKNGFFQPTGTPKKIKPKKK